MSNEYQSNLDQKLLTVNPKNKALMSRNFRCKLHKKELQVVHNDIIGCIKQASSNCLPHTSNVDRNKERKVVPGWNEHVKEHAINAKYWNDIWIRSGKPRNDGIARMRAITKLRYHYAVRYVNSENIRLRNQRMGEAIAGKNDRVLWEEVKKMTKSSNELPSMMDGQTGIDEISKIFADKCETLYNTVSYDNHDMENLRKKIETHIENVCPNDLVQTNHKQNITVKELKDAVEMLKLGKKEENGLYSNHFKYGSERLFVLLTLLFNSMLSHGMAPDELLIGTMIPLIKDGRISKQCSDNYRALTIGTGL